MPRRKKSALLPVLVILVAVSIWIYEAYEDGISQKTFPSTEQTETGGTSPKPTRTGRYDTYRNCTLVPNRSNDGDSFLVKFPSGREEILRLYFVDSPESGFRTYRGGENNHRRIQDQADEMGGISPQQAVSIGKKAKDFTLAHLTDSRFTVFTEWDSPFNDRRYHAFVEFDYNGKSRFLHEVLVENGYARIHTKGAALPDGTSERRQEEYLFELQKIAKSRKSGVWGL